MGGWTIHEGRVTHLPIENIDTDQLIPARFMSQPRANGYGNFLLYDLRRNDDGDLDVTFPLNGADPASILLTGRNFGSGSSREAAVYALVDAGFRVVIAPGFGDIFAANSVNNGLLPARVTPEDAAKIAAAIAEGVQTLRIDVDAGRISFAENSVTFDLDANWREKLKNGWDDIDLTQQHKDQIAVFRAKHQRFAPWVFDLRSDTTPSDDMA